MIDMDALTAAVRKRRGPACIDKNGACRATPEVAAWYNRLIDMNAAGATPDQKRAALETDRLALRAAGHNI